MLFGGFSAVDQLDTQKSWWPDEPPASIPAPTATLFMGPPSTGRQGKGLQCGESRQVLVTCHMRQVLFQEAARIFRSGHPDALISQRYL